MTERGRDLAARWKVVLCILVEVAEGFIVVIREQPRRIGNVSLAVY